MLNLKNGAVIALATCAAGAGVAITSAAAAATTPRPAAATVKLTVKKTNIGNILVTNGGVIVYIFLKDKKNKDTCPASTGCAAVWPPLTGTVSLGPGVKASLIGHIKVGSKEQITYGGHPLYGYEYNSTSTSYVGYSQFGAAWDAISPSGGVVKNKPV